MCVEWEGKAREAHTRDGDAAMAEVDEVVYELPIVKMVGVEVLSS